MVYPLYGVRGADVNVYILSVYFGAVSIYFFKEKNFGIVRP